MFTRPFLSAVLERAVKTFAQTLAAILVGDGTGILEVDWVAALSVAGMAALVSVLTSVGSDFTTGHGPSLNGSETLDPR